MKKLIPEVFRKHWMYLILAGVLLTAVFYFVISVGDSNYFELQTEYEPHELVEDTAILSQNYFDMQGRTLRIGGWRVDTAYFAALAQEPNRENTDEVLIWENARRVENEFNVKFEEVIVGYDQLWLGLSEPFADIIMLPGNMIFSAMLEGLILPLNITSEYSRVTAVGMGEVWAFACNRPTPDDIFLGVNLDILAEISLPNPIDLYGLGLWSWDAMYEIMYAVAQQGYFGIAGYPSEILSHFIAANDGQLIDSNVQFALNSEAALQAIKFMERIFQANLWEAHCEQCLEGIVLRERNMMQFVEGNAVFFPLHMWMVTNDVIPFEFEMIPFPKGEQNTSGNTWASGWMPGFVVPANSYWDIADIVLIMEELFAWPIEPFHIAQNAAEMGHVVPIYAGVVGDIVRGLIVGQSAMDVINAYYGYYQGVLDEVFTIR